VDLALLTGLALGAAHVFAGPDHLAAVAPLARAGGVRGAWIGARWGLGHSGGVALVALAARWLLESAQVEALSSWSERFVGAALIALGLWGYYRSLRRALPGSSPEEHVHARAAFGFGALHGLAGASHLLGVAPALAQPTRTDTLLYLAGFALGTIAAMAAFAAAIGWTAARSSERWRAKLGHATCAAAVLVGAWWLA
jgi:hypothetical protein